MHDLSKAMELGLAQAGISLDKPVVPVRAAPPVVLEVNRDAVRALLVARGAAAKDLDWLTASCPSLADARAFTPWKPI